MQRNIRTYRKHKISFALLKAFSSMHHQRNKYWPLTKHKGCFPSWFSHWTFDSRFSSGSSTWQQMFDGFITVGVTGGVMGNHLQRHVSKIKGLVKDFCQSQKLLAPLIQAKEVEKLQTWKCGCVSTNPNRSDRRVTQHNRRRRQLFGSVQRTALHVLSDPGKSVLCL